MLASMSTATRCQSPSSIVVMPSAAHLWHMSAAMLTIFSLVATFIPAASAGSVTAIASRDASRNITKILNEFFERGYDKRVRPNYGGIPVEVGITMFIVSISTVSEVKMDFTSDFYFRQTWNDPRLSFEKLDMISNLFVGAEVAKKIWVPDTFFANEKQAYFHVATTPNRFLRISSDGTVFQSIRLTVTSSCPMDLQYFPMDRQSCTIEVESYGYSESDIRYIWAKGKDSVSLVEKLELPQFKVVGYKQDQKHVSMSTGNYSRLICKIQFSRSLGFYMIQIYIPAGLIVVISWVSFWLHRNATPARVALGVTTVLTMTTLMSSTNSQLPKISYIKSIDVFLGTCFLMVFGSLLEYAIVGYLGKRVSMRKSKLERYSKCYEEHRKTCAAAAAAAASMGTFTEPPTAGGQQHGHPGGHPQFHQLSLPQLQTGVPAGLVHSHLVQPVLPAQLPICSTTGLPLDANMQMITKTPFYPQHLNGMAALTQRICHTLPPVQQATKYVYAGPPYRLLDPQLQSKESLASQTTATAPFSVQPSAPQQPAPPPAVPPASRANKEDGAPSAPEPPAKLLLPPPLDRKNPDKVWGFSPSDIDKYSRVVFPVCFTCFNLMYWVIYKHISEVKISGLIPLKSD